MNLPNLPEPTAHRPISRALVKLSWVLALLALMGVGITLWLGTWQLRRASQKEALAQHIYQQNALPAVENTAQAAMLNVAADTTQIDNILQRNVLLQGTWLNQHTVFLDNRYMAGRAGFYVVTPLQLQGVPRVVWVQRGWVARNAQDRALLPSIPAAQGTVVVRGKAVKAVSSVYALGQDPSSPSSGLGLAGASRIRQNLPELALGSQLQWLPWAVLQTYGTQATLEAGVAANPPQLASQDTDGLLREWPAPDAGVSKHYGYAFQWFALCGLIIGLYVWFHFIAPRRRKI